MKKLIVGILLIAVSAFAADKPRRVVHIETEFNIVYVGTIKDSWMFTAPTDSEFAPTVPVIVPIDATDRDVRTAMEEAGACASYYEWLMNQKPHAFTMPTHPPQV